MSISGIGSSYSLWQQDQNYWQQAKENDNETAANNAVINAIANAQTNLGKGLASIANQTALSRVNSQLSAAIQSLLDGGSTASSSSSTSSNSSASSGSAGSKAVPATATGTAPLTTSTPLSNLGILAGGSITVSAGLNTTTYTSTGSDTVGDLMAALNNHLVGNAAVTASLNSTGDLVITSSNTTDTIMIGGVYASNIGFAVGNRTFEPTPGSSASSAAASSTTSSSAQTSTGTTQTKQSYSTLLSENISTAASLLSDSGVAGNLVDMLS